MTLSGGRVLFVGALVGVSAVMLARFAGTHAVGSWAVDVLDGRARSTWPPPRRTPTAAGQVAGSIAEGLATLAAVAATITLPAVAVLIVSRSIDRRRRTRVLETLELGLGRDDTADPFKVQEAFEGIAGSLAARWYRRLVHGQDHVALEVTRDGRGMIAFAAAGTAGALQVVRVAMKELYPEVDLRPTARPEGTVRSLVRLKKARPYFRSLQTVQDYRHAFSEALVAGLDTAKGSIGVQLVLTPAPIALHRRSRTLLRRRERALRARHGDVDPGPTSGVESKELRDALATQHRSLFYFDLRIFAEHSADATRVAGLFAQLRADNELRQRDIRLRRAWFAGRVARAVPNLWPSLRTGLLSTSELATMWQLPRARMKDVRLNRSTTRRAIAPPQVDRSPQNELMNDGVGPVGLAAGDRQFGHALVGGQGGGKSSVMARSLLAAARDGDRAIILFDPKGPLAELVLGLLPPERVVHYLDLAQPEFGFNPLALDATPALRSSLVVRAMIEANPPGSIQAASDSFLRQAIAAVCTVEREPTFWHVYRMFDFVPGASYRAQVVAKLHAIPGSDFARGYWRREFPSLVHTRAFAVQALNPPRNKLERLLATPEVDMLLRHPVALDLGRIIDERQVLVVCGAKATVGEDNVVFVMQLLLQQLHRALQARQRDPAGVPHPVSLFIDEAHNLLTPSVATMLAEGRSAGLEASFAWQYSAQIVDDVIRSGLRSLLQSISIFRMREIDDARSLAGLAMEVYADRIGVDIAEQERLRFSADDIVRLPAHRAINLWIAGGVPRPGFVAESLPMEALYDVARAGLHQQRQRDRGAFVPSALPDPMEQTVPPDSSRPSPSPSAPEQVASVESETKPERPPDPSAVVDLEDLP